MEWDADGTRRTDEQLEQLAHGGGPGGATLK